MSHFRKPPGPSGEACNAITFPSRKRLTCLNIKNNFGRLTVINLDPVCVFSYSVLEKVGQLGHWMFSPNCVTLPNHGIYL